jgi:CheY-like chemotaxis protein
VVAATTDLRSTVLVVDDDELLRVVLLRGIGRRGASVLEADCGARALEMIARAQPSLVVLDLELPDMNGIKVLSALHALHPGVRVVVFSASLNERLSDEVQRLGAVGWIAKPDIAALFERVTELLGSGAAREQTGTRRTREETA